MIQSNLQVQRIKNEFTVAVYEIHARMALEVVSRIQSWHPVELLVHSAWNQGDMVEYNQCQATLKTLYEIGIPGKIEEFTAYRILMLLHGRNRSGLFLTSLPYSCRLTSEYGGHHRIKPLRRSANAQTEIGCRRATRACGTACGLDGQLPRTFRVVHRCAEHGRIYHGSFH